MMVPGEKDSKDGGLSWEEETHVVKGEEGACSLSTEREGKKDVGKGHRTWFQHHAKTCPFVSRVESQWKAIHTGRTVCSACFWRVRKEGSKPWWGDGEA